MLQRYVHCIVQILYWLIIKLDSKEYFLETSAYLIFFQQHQGFANFFICFSGIA